MGRGVELATGYVTLTVETADLSRQVGRMFTGATTSATSAGRNMGRSMAQAFEQSRPDVDSLRADVERAEARIVASTEQSARKQEASKRKVEIAQAKLNEAVRQHGPTSSQALTAVDRLATAEQRLESETGQAASAQQRLQTELSQSQTALTNASTASETASRTYATGWRGVGQRIRGYLTTGTREATDAAEVQAERGGRESGSGFSTAFKGAIAGIATYFSVQAVAGFVAGTANLAGAAEQSVGAIDSVFKDHAKQMHDWSKAAATAVGISSNEYRELGTLLGAQLKNAGTPMDELSGKTNKLIGLGADMSSMFGGTTKEAIEAISSALKGEMDPIEKYGITLNEAAIEAEALSKGLLKPVKDADAVSDAATKMTLAQKKYNEVVKKHGKDSDEAIRAKLTLSAAERAYDKATAGKVPKLKGESKALAIQSALFTQSADAQGNFMREQDTFEHKKQVAIASWDDMKIKIGNEFLPALTVAMDFIATRAIPAVGAMVEGIKGFIQAIRENAGTIGMIAGIIGTILLPALVRLGVGAVIAGAKQLAAWAMSGAGAVQTGLQYIYASYTIVASWVKMGLAAIKSGAETAAIWLMYRVDSLKAVAAMIVAKIKIAAQWVAMSAAAVASGIKTGVVWTVQVIGKAVAGAVAFGVQVARVVGGWVLMGVQAGIQALKMAAGWTVGVLLPAVAGGIAMGIQAAIVVGGWVLMGAQAMAQAVRMAAAWFIALGPIGWVIGAVVGLVALIIANWDTVKRWTIAAWEAVSGAVATAWRSIIRFISEAWTNIKIIFTQLTNFVRTALALAFTWLRDSVIMPVWNGIKNAINVAWLFVKVIFQAYINFIRGALTGAFNFLKDVVKNVWNGIKTAISSVWEKGIKPVFNALMTMVKTTIPDAFRKGRDAVDAIWKKVANIARKPVNFMIGTVYNDGLKSMFNGIAGKLGLPWKLPDVSGIPAFAKGGEMRKGWKLVGEEGPELINTGAGFVHTARETQQMLAGKKQAPEDSLSALSGDNPRQARLANGGFWGDVWGNVKSGVGKVKDWAVGQIGSAVKALVQPIKNGMTASLPGAGMNELIRGAGFKVIDDMTNWAVKKDEAAAPAGGEYAGSYDGAMGRFHRPSAGPYTSMFGPRWGAFHAGVDIAGGGKTFAALNGIVKFIGKGGGLPGRTGHGIRLDHGGGFQTYYGHNPYNGPRVKVGQRVKGGQHIGYQGNTGNVTGTHLHFETLKNNRAVNPMGYLHDQGGMHDPGTWSFNGLKKPEAVLTPRHWDIAEGAIDQVTSGNNKRVYVVIDGQEFSAHMTDVVDGHWESKVRGLQQPSRQFRGAHK